MLFDSYIKHIKYQLTGIGLMSRNLISLTGKKCEFLLSELHDDNPHQNDLFKLKL